MISAAFRVMLLGLLRDRAALVMAFVLPTLIFAIFAAIFSGRWATASASISACSISRRPRRRSG